MRNILVICGKTASGKNLVRDIIVEKYNYNPIVTYTSRPPRKGEKQDVTYHFISTDEFLEKMRDEIGKENYSDTSFFFGNDK